MAFHITERSSGRYRVTLLDEDNNPVPGSLINSVTITLYDRKTDTLIRDNEELLGSGASVTEQGVLTWDISETDTPIVGTQPSATAVYVDGERVRGIEDHIALFHIYWGNFTKSMSFQFTMNVVDLGHLS
jgi:hypothetical protein